MFSPILPSSGLTGYQYLERTRAQQQDLLAKSPLVARDTQAFRDRIKDIETPEQLMEDRALLRVALGAFGLGDDINNSAFIRKVLESDLQDGTSLANKLADKRYLALAKTFNFSGKTASTEGLKTSEDVQGELDGITSAQDLLSNRPLLRATLSRFGLEGDVDNTYFLEQVLASDPADGQSFAARLGNPAYADLAATFDFTARQQDENTIYGFAARFGAEADSILTYDDLLENEALLEASIKLFGLEDGFDDPDLLEQVLTADLSDPGSLPNTLDDKRYAALAGVFDFAARAEAEAEAAALADPEAEAEPFESTLQKTLAVVNARKTPLEDPAGFTQDSPFMLAVMDFFDLTLDTNSARLTTRMLQSDLSSETSLANVYLDKRYNAFANAFDFSSGEAPRSYPAGFADAVIGSYLDRQFEIEVGAVDNSMRLAMAAERELGTVVANTSTNNGRWYGVLASEPLRSLFETTFNLPDGFSGIDIDQQVTVLQERTERMFGSDQVADLLKPEALEELRRTFMVQSEIAQFSVGMSSAAIVSTLLASSGLNNQGF